MYKILIASTFVWIIVIQVFVAIHYYIIEIRKNTPNHALSFVISFLLGMLLAGLIYDHMYFRVVALLYYGLLYWVLFNLELNLLRGKPALYLGKDSVLDRIEASMKNPAMTLLLKITIIMMCAFILLDL